MKRDRQQTPQEGRSQFEKATALVEEVKAKIQRNEARNAALFEKLKANLRELERLDQKRAARERASSQRTRRQP